MVKKWFFLLFMLPYCLFSGEFTANVSSNQVGLAETLTLNLTLKNTFPKGSPTLDRLGEFVISSQQQSSNMSMINGHITSSTTWKLELTPQKEGTLVIPAIDISTGEGILSTAPITIQVIHGAASTKSSTSDTNGVFLSTDISNAKPYKNEPILYTLKLSSKAELANITMQKLNIEDAFVEMHGETKVYKRVVDGVILNVIEFSYLITPLKAGAVNIPSAVIQGGMVAKRKSHIGSLFEDDLDPFDMMPGFNRLKPFTVSTEGATLDVQPAVADINPWLPAKSVTIEEIWDESQVFQEGEPINRSFKIVAEGIKSTQLPSLNDQLSSVRFFKVYADKPELDDEMDEGNLVSFRKEQYTLIPQQSGSLTLPEMSIVWWDVNKKEKALARVAARTVQIAPSAVGKDVSNNKIALELAEGDKNFSEVAVVPKVVIKQYETLIYALIAGLAFLLLVVGSWGIWLQRKVVSFSKKPVEMKKVIVKQDYSKYSDPNKKSVDKNKKNKKDKEDKEDKKDKKEKLPDLNPT